MGGVDCVGLLYHYHLVSRLQFVLTQLKDLLNTTVVLTKIQFCTIHAQLELDCKLPARSVNTRGASCKLPTAHVPTVCK